MSEKRKQWLKENRQKLTSRKYEDKVASEYVNTIYDARDLEELHGTYQYEMQMLEYIRQGKTAKLEKLLLGYTEQEGYHEGKVAEDDLRQTKNIFIGLVAMVGKSAAIPGGMPVEQAYYLIDAYTRQCEAMDDPIDIYNLQYNMILDFSERVSRYRYGRDLSPLIRDCMNFIILHLNEPIRAIDVIEFSGRSRSFLSSRFKEETGMEIGSFITKVKIEEAQSLLRYSERNISEISEYLSFSSQPYFQNVFKKITGLTPRQYREQKNGI